ncbi:class I SAM-dependent methyltransferase [Bowmanella dokdonensis]|uniref:Class I SAM-dependent methyltransferase n=1 Tax=Bowmanella dokdonensis TaxID=751969 RepID=A0A939DNP1_9ALTE|nr:class I SAM-dependent methyltransferase [Bowmanella dokdonensis]MBN7825552.1 class I SAM-dependent methyltransferase [Bowmanella dokdonensis]
MSLAYADAWDAYWQNACSADFTDKEVDQPLLSRLWRSLFLEEFRQHCPAIMLEVACGKGAVSEIARHCMEEIPGPSPTHLCLDYSLAAVKTSCQRANPDAGLVADAARLPLQPGSVDLIFSQFGIEYAGKEAILECARLLRKNGLFSALIHYRESAISMESQNNHAALSQVEASLIFARARVLFKAGFATSGSPEADPAFRQADQSLAPAVSQVTAVLQRFGPGVAGGIVLQFYRDLGQMFNNMQAYELTAILDWLDRMEQELLSYRQRMASMLGAAMDAGQITQTAQQLETCGLKVEKCSPIESEQGILAWHLQGRAR